jgi:hypothetical protein
VDKTFDKQQGSLAMRIGWTGYHAR